MKAVGAIAIVIAAILAWVAFSHFQDAGNAGVLAKVTGVDQVSAEMGTKFAIGAGVLGFVGIVLIAAGSKN